jgi:hypothetical protein
MIKVLINGTPIYKLCFARRSYATTKQGQPLYETDALIFIADAKQGEPAVAKASARQYHKDKYNPEAARVAAIKQLLNPAKGDIAPTFSRVERTAIWKAYWDRPRDGGKPKSKPTPPAGAGSAPAHARQAHGGHSVISKIVSFPERRMWAA